MAFALFRAKTFPPSRQRNAQRAEDFLIFSLTFRRVLAKVNSDKSVEAVKTGSKTHKKRLRTRLTVEAISPNAWKM